MISPIKILPGEGIHENIPGDRYLTPIDRNIIIISVFIKYGEKYIEFRDNSTGYLYEARYSEMFSKENQKYYSRIGYILPGNVFDTEDYLCHDHRCFPSDLGGCTLCQYSERSKQRKRFFYPGDEVYVPEFKKVAKVEVASIGFNFAGLEREYESLRGYTCGNLGRKSVLVAREMKSNCDLIVTAIKLYSKDRLGVYYKMEGIGGFYSYSEIRIAKRKNYLIDLEQLDYICSEICLYGKGSPKCERCETKKYKDSIRNDLQRNYRKI